MTKVSRNMRDSHNLRINPETGVHEKLEPKPTVFARCEICNADVDRRGLSSHKQRYEDRTLLCLITDCDSKITFNARSLQDHLRDKHGVHKNAETGVLED